MSGNEYGFITLLLLGIGVAIFLYLLVRKSLRALLDEVVGLPAATTFFARILLLGVLFIAFSQVLNTSFDLKPDAAFMEYVWKVAAALSPLFGYICLFVTGYLIIVAILVAALKRRHE